MLLTLYTENSLHLSNSILSMVVRARVFCASLLILLQAFDFLNFILIYCSHRRLGIASAQTLLFAYFFSLISVD